MRRRSPSAIAAAALLLAGCSNKPPHSPLRANLAVDLPITLGAAAVGGFSEAAKGSLCGPSCYPSYTDPKLRRRLYQDLNSLDRPVVGNHSTVAAGASDALLIMNVAAPFVLDAFDVASLDGRTGDRWAGYGTDALILAEVLALDVALNNVVKYAVRRPRPFVYSALTCDPARPDSDACDKLHDPDALLSFYSGHSSISFASATAYSTLFTMRHPRWSSALVWITLEGLATVTASLRVAAGKHFVTDVITGAVVGGSIGFLVPYLHRRLPLPELSVSRRAYRLQFLPTAFPGGAGLSLLVR